MYHNEPVFKFAILSLAFTTSAVLASAIPASTYRDDHRPYELGAYEADEYSYAYDGRARNYDADDYDGNQIVFDIDRDRDGRFNHQYTDYPFFGQHLTKEPYGQIIRHCKKPGTIALTFDDGPSGYDTEDEEPKRTEELLDVLKEEGMVATFFLGNNKRFAQSGPLLRRMVDEGHQLGHHSTNHPYFTQLSRDEIYREMNELEYLFNKHLGFSPTYMRLPFLDGDKRVLQVLEELRYHVVSIDNDTFDWKYNSKDEIQNSIDAFNSFLSRDGRLVLAHEKHQWTMERILPAMIRRIKELKLTSVTVGECLGDPRENWYRRVRRDFA